MGGIARHGDAFTSFLVWGSPTLVATTVKTFVNGKGVARQGDTNPHFHIWPGHGLVPVSGTVATASSSVSAEGKKIARIGDTLSCHPTLGNCTIIAGSSDVLSG